MIPVKEESYLIASLNRGIETLFAFLESPEMSFSAFMRATGLNKAAAKRILFTFEKNGVVKYNKKRNVYSLGIRLFELGTVASENLPLLKVSRPYMESIASEINETVIVAQKVDNEQIYLYKIEGEGTVQLPTLVGHRRPLYYGLGKTILAYLSEEEQLKCLPENIPLYSTKTIQKRELFLQELNKIKQQGYAIDEEEYIERVIGIGAPIFLGESQIFGLIGVVGPNYRMTCPKRENVVELLCKASQAISRKLNNYLDIDS